MFPPFTDIKPNLIEDKSGADWFLNNEVIDVISMHGNVMDDDFIDDDDDSNNLVIDLSDIPMSCKDDLFSDQFVENAANSLQSEDILNMEIIFDDDLGGSASSHAISPINQQIIDTIVCNGNATRTPKAEKEIFKNYSANHNSPVAVNDIINVNAKETAEATVDSHIVSVKEKDTVYVSSAYAHYETDIMTADHVPDIEQQIADTSDDSLQSHLSSSSSVSLPVFIIILKNYQY